MKRAYSGGCLGYRGTGTLVGYHIGRYIPRSWLPSEALRAGDPVPGRCAPSAGTPAVASAARGVGRHGSNPSVVRSSRYGGGHLMRSVICTMGVSLDGYIVGPDGDFNWTAPDEEIFRSH